MTLLNQAVNVLLQTIGEQSLGTGEAVTGVYEAEEALKVLALEREAILSQGLNCNTDEAWLLTPDTAGYISVPGNVIRIESEDIDVIVKNGNLYNKDAMSYLFDGSIECKIIWDLDFDAIPFAIQNYIVKRSAKVMYQRFVGDINMLKVLMNDEQEAKLNMIDHDVDTSDYNIFDNSTTMRIINRTTNPTGLRG